MGCIEMTKFVSDKKSSIYREMFSVEEAQKVRAFHCQLEEYTPTPLRELKNLSEVLGISRLYVKDESYRFGLNAFKGLGGSYAVAKVIAEAKGIRLEEVSGIEADSFTFVTATDGNQGRGLPGRQKNFHRKRWCICRKVLRRSVWTISGLWEQRQRSQS